MQTLTSLDWIGLGADIIGIFGAIFALLAWHKAKQIQQEHAQERARRSKMVQVILQHGARKIELPVELRRAELSRAEILGRIGMIPMRRRGERFSLSSLNKPEFLKQINQVIEGRGDGVLIISCTQEELEQFDIDTNGVNSEST